MKYSAGRQGRIFIVRLEDGDVVHKCLEELARKEAIKAAAVIAVGGADSGSTLVTGPKVTRGEGPICPTSAMLSGAHEIVGTGTIFQDEEGKPLLHMHFACGRGTETVTGCIRNGVISWHIVEAIVFEVEDVNPVRKLNNQLGFKLLEPEGE